MRLVTFIFEKLPHNFYFVNSFILFSQKIHFLSLFIYSGSLENTVLSNFLWFCFQRHRRINSAQNATKLTDLPFKLSPAGVYETRDPSSNFISSAKSTTYL